MNARNGLLAAIALSGTTALGGVQLGDFWVTDASGQIYEVNGDTLQAAASHQIQSDGLANEIAYLGNNMMMANMTGSLVTIDLMTGQEQTVFNVSDHFGDGNVRVAGGLALRNGSDMYFTIQTIPTNGSPTSTAATLNLNSNSYSFVSAVDVINGTAFDHHMVGIGDVLTADYQGQRVWVRNQASGLTRRIIDVDYDIVSFMEFEGNLITMTQQGDLYQLFLDTEVSNYIGTISGAGADLIGATALPTPGGLCVLGGSGLIATRRRRS